MSVLGRELRTDRHWARLGLGLFSLLLVVAVVAAACGGGGDDSDGDSETSDSRSERGERADRAEDAEGAAAPADAPAEAPAEANGVAPPAPAGAEEEPARAAPAVRESGVLRLARGEPLTLDPALTTDVTSAEYVVEIFGGLVTLDQDLNVVADLAEEIPEPIFNADGTVTYRFVIRPDALYHDGSTRVSAEDVKWSIERNASPDTFSPTAIDYLGDIVGLKDYARGRSGVTEVTGIQVINDRTVEITIDEPKPYFLQKLTYPTAYVLYRDQVERDPEGWARDPIGTGPFQLRNWELGEGLTLVPWDRYHLGPAQLEEVRIRFAGGGLTQYENEEVDIAGIGINDIERARDPASTLNAEFVSRSELSTFYIGFNVNQPPFDDRDVRRAFSMAVDKGAIIEITFQNVVVVAEGILPPGMPGYDPDFRGLPFDPTQAKALLDGSSYAGSPLLDRIRLTVSGAGATPGALIEAVRDMWQQNLGLAVEIQQVETASFFSELDRGFYQAFSLGWSADYPDPENFLDLLFHGRSLQNNPAYDNAEVNTLLEQARVEQDPQRRIEIYRQVERIIVDDAPWLLLFHGQKNEVVKPYVQGYVPPRSVIPYLRFITLSD